MHTLGQYYGTLIACRYTIPPALASPDSHDELIEFFEFALARAVLEHPVLQVGLVGANPRKPAWTRLETVNFRNHITWQTAEDSTAFNTQRRIALQLHLDTEFTKLETQPGWRITVLRQEGVGFLEVIFSWNHANSDGMGAKVFHQTLLRYLNKIESDEALPGFKDRVLRLPTTIDRFPPTQHQLVKFTLTPEFVLKTGLRELVSPALAPKRSAQAAWAPILSSPYKTQLRWFSVDQECLARILLACRRHSTTITALLHVLCLASLASQLGEREARAFEAGTALTMRRFLPSRPPSHPWFEPDRAVGNLVSAMSHRFAPDLVARVRSCIVAPGDGDRDGNDDNLLGAEALETAVWAVASAVRGEIVARLEMGVRNDITGMMKFVGDWRAQMRATARRPRALTWVVTNLGVLDGAAAAREGGGEDVAGDDEQRAGEEGRWSIDQAQFALSAEVASAVFMVSPIAVKGKELVVSCSWQDCVVDAGLGERLTANLERWIKQIGSASS